MISIAECAGKICGRIIPDSGLSSDLVFVSSYLWLTSLSSSISVSLLPRQTMHYDPQMRPRARVHHFRLQNKGCPHEEVAVGRVLYSLTIEAS